VTPHLHHGPAGGAEAHEHVPVVGHLPLVEDGEGCLEILVERLRDRPGIVAIEADFKDRTLTVRYQPSRVTPDELNALADDVGSMFAQRVTACEQRETLDSCEACALRLGRLDPSSATEFRASATRGRISLARHHEPEECGRSRTSPGGPASRTPNRRSALAVAPWPCSPAPA